MIYINDKMYCCGCTACASICFQQAIVMQPDELGFKYPTVDLGKCIECGLCEQVCQFRPDYERYDNYDIPKAYSLRVKDTNQLMHSQSGGAFWAFATKIIKDGGVVYGAGFHKIWRVVHKRVSSLIELEDLRMSKYVQSDIEGIFIQIKRDLMSGVEVLFSGTSCQVAGLKKFIPRRLHSHLICIDIICHGVPSPKIWEDYITYIERINSSQIQSTCFRDKKFGWNTNKQRFTLSNGNVIYGEISNYLYFRGLSIRECCANCYFTNTQRVGDLTIGDFWSIEKYTSKYNDDLGVSLILINSLVGDDMLNRIKDIIEIEEFQLNMCIQPQLENPVALNQKVSDFRTDYIKYGFMYIAKKYGNLGWNYRMQYIKNRIKKIIKHGE